MGRLITLINLQIIGVVLLFSSCFKGSKETQKLVKIYTVTFEDTSSFDGYSEVDRKNQINHVAKISKEIPYGGGLFFDLPDSLLNKSLRFIFKAKVRNKGWNTFGHSIVISTNTKDGNVLNWYELNMDDFVKKKDEWNNMIDSIQISADRNTTPGSRVKIFGYNGSKRDFMEYDELIIELKTVEYIE